MQKYFHQILHKTWVKCLWNSFWWQPIVSAYTSESVWSKLQYNFVQVIEMCMELFSSTIPLPCDLQACSASVAHMHKYWHSIETMFFIIKIGLMMFFFLFLRRPQCLYENLYSLSVLCFPSAYGNINFLPSAYWRRYKSNFVVVFTVVRYCCCGGCCALHSVFVSFVSGYLLFNRFVESYRFRCKNIHLVSGGMAARKPDYFLSVERNKKKANRKGSNRSQLGIQNDCVANQNLAAMNC